MVDYRHHSHNCTNLNRITSTCGLWRDCTPAYKLSDINASIFLWDPYSTEIRMSLNAAHRKAQQECLTVGNVLNRSTAPVRSSGAYCYAEPSVKVTIRGEHSYRQPACYRYVADAVVVAELAALLVRRRMNDDDNRDLIGLGEQRNVYLSLNDFGAGVGQYGHALHALDPRIRWRGWDGAGNVAKWTEGFVEWFDLTLPKLSLPRADWVMCLEVAEHIPAKYEVNVIRNLHAHNCRGIILSWAVLGQMGHNHVNNHANSYLVSQFERLGYRYDSVTSARFSEKDVRNPNVRALPLQVHPWFRKGGMLVFRRWHPIC